MRHDFLLRFSALALAAFLTAATSGARGTYQEPEKKTDSSGQESGVPRGSVRGKKLMLRDGTYQLVRSYEVRGDRVRYYSVERSAWEEIPAELVDLEATRRTEADEEALSKKLEEKARRAEAAERSAEVEVDASVEIAPGVFLPAGVGLYAIEYTAKGAVPALLGQTATTSNRDKGRIFEKIMIPGPAIPDRYEVRVPGKYAAKRLTANQLEFYIRLADDRSLNLELVRLRGKGNVRLVEGVSVYMETVKRSDRKTLSFQVWPIAPRVSRLTLGEPLAEGEYAFVEITNEGIATFIWDFGIGPAPQTDRKNSPKKPENK